MGNLDILYEESNTEDKLGMKQFNISVIRDLFAELLNLDKHSGGIVIDIKPERVTYLSNTFLLESFFWNDTYKWARQ